VAAGAGVVTAIAAVMAKCTCRPVRGFSDAEPICGDSPLGPRVYRCAGCGEHAPWCFGAADDLPGHCDDCWDKAQRKEPS
jgi:hypothetical protein